MNVRRVKNELLARRAEQVADLLPSMIVAVVVASRRPLPTTVTTRRHGTRRTTRPWCVMPNT